MHTVYCAERFLFGGVVVMFHLLWTVSTNWPRYWQYSRHLWCCCLSIIYWKTKHKLILKQPQYQTTLFCRQDEGPHLRHVLQIRSQLDKGHINAIDNDPRTKPTKQEGDHKEKQTDQGSGNSNGNESGKDVFKRTPQKHSCWTGQFAATGAFAGARVVLKDQVQKGFEHCQLSFTRLMAHSGTVPAEKSWLGVAGFAPKQFVKPGLVALGKCAVRLETSADLRPPVQVWFCVDDTEFVNGAQSAAPF